MSNMYGIEGTEIKANLIHSKVSKKRAKIQKSMNAFVPSCFRLFCIFAAYLNIRYKIKYV